MSKRIWHYEKDGKVEGPVTEDALRALIESGEIRPHTLVWAHPMDDWALAAEIEGLKPLFPPAPPPLPQFRQPPPLPGAGAGRETDSVPGASPFASAVKPDTGVPVFNAPSAAPGASVTAPGKPAPQTPETTGSDQRILRAFLRFLARSIDEILFLIIVLIVLVFMSLALRDIYLLELLTDTILRYFIAPVFLFTWAFIEAWFICSYGQTLGKMILGIKVTDIEGRLLSYNAALNRSINVWFRGLGIGFPIITWITMAVAFIRYQESGATSWDRDGNIIVTHGNWGK